MIILNDSISKFYQCSIQSFCRGMSMFFDICLGKKIAEAIKFLEILKQYISKNKIFLFKKEKQCFWLSHGFQTWFHNADHLLH